MRVGDLAKESGVSVRTLHHYHEIGLLVPTRHNPGGHRIYSTADLLRLQQIRSLRQIGLSLAEIREFLETPEGSALQVLEQNLARARDDLAAQEGLCQRLEDLLTPLRKRAEPSAQSVLDALAATARADRYFSAEQRDLLRERRAVTDPERIRAVEGEWDELFDQFADALRRGHAPDSDPVQALAVRAQALVLEFTGGDAGLLRSLGEMYRKEGAETVLGAHGMAVDPDVFAFMSEAMRRLRADRG